MLVPAANKYTAHSLHVTLLSGRSITQMSKTMNYASESNLTPINSEFGNKQLTVHTDRQTGYDLRLKLSTESLSIDSKYIKEKVEIRNNYFVPVALCCSATNASYLRKC